MRLIDADELKKAIKKELPKMSNWGETFIPLLIDNAPTVTPSLFLDNITEADIEKFKMIWQRVNGKGLLVTNEESRHGKWDEICEPFGWDDILSARCSVCGESYPYPEETGFNDIVEMFKYCPNCGAKMEAGDRWKEEEDEE